MPGGKVMVHVHLDSLPTTTGDLCYLPERTDDNKASAACDMVAQALSTSITDQSFETIPKPRQRMNAGGLIILARVKPSPETDFAQILLPIALSYDTFICKVCVALGIEVASVRKVLKLPDILIRSTEDVVRLEEWDKIEIRVKRPSLLRNGYEKWNKSIKNIFSRTLFWTIMISSCFLLYKQFEMTQQLTLEHATTLSKVTQLEEIILKQNSAISELQKSFLTLQKSQNVPSNNFDPTTLDKGIEKLNAIQKDQRNVAEVLGRRMEGMQRSIDVLSEKVKETSKGLSALKSAIYD